MSLGATMSATTATFAVRPTPYTSWAYRCCLPRYLTLSLRSAGLRSVGGTTYFHSSPARAAPQASNAAMRHTKVVRSAIGFLPLVVYRFATDFNYPRYPDRRRQLLSTRSVVRPLHPPAAD